jgi:ParB-like chromosome segregation protein Spo0J
VVGPAPGPSKRTLKRLRGAEHRAARQAHPPAADALRRVLAWKAAIDAGTVTQADIARRERLTRARVCQLMKLSALPEGLQARLLSEDPSVAGMTVRDALQNRGDWSRRLRLVTEAGVGFSADAPKRAGDSGIRRVHPGPENNGP